jgi:hypothetical protein
MQRKTAQFKRWMAGVESMQVQGGNERVTDVHADNESKVRMQTIGWRERETE